MGICCMNQGTHQGLCDDLEGWDEEGDGREAWEGWDIGAPKADSC